MKHVLTVALGLALAFLFNPTEAHAQAATRTSSQADLMRALNGSPQYLGRIVAGTTVKDNSNTSGTTFNITKGSILLIVPTAAVCVLAGTSAASATAKCDGTADTGVPLKAEEKFYMTLMTNEGWLQAITAAGAANVDVWRLR